MELLNAFIISLQAVWADSGFASFTVGNGIMILVGIVLLYLAKLPEHGLPRSDGRHDGHQLRYQV